MNVRIHAEAKKHDYPFDSLNSSQISFPTALEICLANVIHTLPAESVEIADSFGRILREDVKSMLPIPSFPRSAMDGYAVQYRDIIRASEDFRVRLKIIGEMPAGSGCSCKINAGETVRIMTGAPIPDGADSVVPMENALSVNGYVDIIKAPGNNDYILHKGQDVKKGKAILFSGHRIGPPEMGMLAACGKTRVNVSQKPRVAILSTGNEVASPESSQSPNQIYDINSHTLIGMASSVGATPHCLGIAKDCSKELDTFLKDNELSDILVITGGLSNGKFDIVRDALLNAGIHQTLFGVEIKPAKPIFVGTRGKQLVFGFPGNPVAVMINFLLFAVPVIHKMQGYHAPGLKTGYANILNNRLLKPNARRFYTGKLETKDGIIGVSILPTQKTGMFYPMVDADVLVEVPDGVKYLRKGDLLKTYYINSYF